MDSFLPIWNGYIVFPLIEGLRLLGHYTSSGGLAIILFTILVRVAMLPLSIYQMKSQKAMMAIQPQIKEIQRKYGKDRERMTQETMRVYKEYGVNPASGCLPLVIQMPIFIGLYSALITLSSHDHGDPQFRESFLWLPNLGDPDPLYILPILTGATQFLMQRMMTMPTSDPQQQMMNRMMTFMPLMFLAMTFQFASGLVLYWVVSNAFSMIQQYFTTGWGALWPLWGGSAAPAAAPAANPAAAAADPNNTDERPATRRAARGGRPSGKRRRGGKR